VVQSTLTEFQRRLLALKSDRRGRIQELIDCFGPLSIKSTSAEEREKQEAWIDELRYLTWRRPPKGRNFKLEVESHEEHLKIWVVNQNDTDRLLLNSLAPQETIVRIGGGFYATPNSGSGHADKIIVNYSGLLDNGGIFAFFHELGHLYTGATRRYYEFTNQENSPYKKAKQMAIQAKDFFYSSTTSTTPLVNYWHYLTDDYSETIKELTIEAEKEAWNWALAHAQTYDRRFNIVSEIGQDVDVKLYMAASILISSYIGFRTSLIPL
jgi:hypothetical protein